MHLVDDPPVLGPASNIGLVGDDNEDETSAVQPLAGVPYPRQQLKACQGLGRARFPVTHYRFV